MTDDGHGDSNADPTPEERAMRGMRAAMEKLADAEGGNAIEQATAETEAVDEMVDAVAQALVDGLNKPVGFYAGAVSEECNYNTKTDLKQQIKDRVEELRGSDKPPLDEFVEDRLEEVTVVKTTDARQGAEYIWDFGTFKVETRSGKDRRGHFAFDNFRNYIHESGGVNLARPQPDRRGGEEWRDFIAEMIDERGTDEYTVGARTQAFEALKNKVKRLTGYGTPESALDHTGIWVVREQVDLPEWWRGLGTMDPSDDRDLPSELVKEVRVHESVIQPIIDDADITRSALYHELNARNLTVPGTSGASMTEWVNGSDERFWTFLPDLGTPRTYVPDPHAGVTVRPGFFDVENEQRDDQPEETGHSRPVESGAEDAHDGSDGFDSVGDTA